MGKTRDLLKKKRYQRNISCKDGHKKDRNGMDLTEAEDVKKRWQEYTEKLHKKDLQDPDNHDGVITHHKASGGDEIPVELFQIRKDDAVKVLHSLCQQIWKTLQWPQDWKKSIFIQIPKKGNAKECQTTAQLHSSHTLVK